MTATRSATSLGLSTLDQVALSCTNLDAARRFYCDTLGLRDAGVEIVQDAQCIARNWHGRDVYLAFFKDPFGNTLALKSDVPAIA